MSKVFTELRQMAGRLATGGKSNNNSEQANTHSLTWMTPERSGTMPSVRNGHTADLIDSRIYVFGGGDKADLLSDLFVYDVRDQKWHQPPCTGVVPPPRSRHCSAVIDRNLYIWGGIGGGIDVHVLDTVAMDWTTPTAHGTVPDSRFGHTCVAVDPASQPRLIVLGGHNSKQALSDVHVRRTPPRTSAPPCAHQPRCYRGETLTLVPLGRLRLTTSRVPRWPHVARRCSTWARVSCGGTRPMY